jgi:hypothetical protein
VKYSHDGKSVSKYAERLGETTAGVSQNKSAYEVYSHCKKSLTRVNLLGLSAKHIRLIHPAPQQYWIQLVQSTIDNHWTTSEMQDVRCKVQDVIGRLALFVEIINFLGIQIINNLRDSSL